MLRFAGISWYFFSCLSIPCFGFLSNVSSIFCYSGIAMEDMGFCQCCRIDIRGRIPWAGESAGIPKLCPRKRDRYQHVTDFPDTRGANCLNIWLIPVTQNTLHKVTKNKPPKGHPMVMLLWPNFAWKWSSKKWWELPYFPVVFETITHLKPLPKSHLFRVKFIKLLIASTGV